MAQRSSRSRGMSAEDRAAAFAIALLATSCNSTLERSIPSAPAATPATVADEHATEVEIAPLRFAFGEVARGAPLIGRITLANRGLAALTLARAQLVGAPARLRWEVAGAAPRLADTRTSESPVVELTLLPLASGTTATLDFAIASDELAAGPAAVQLELEWDPAGVADEVAHARALRIPIDFAVAEPAVPTALVAEPAVIDFGTVFRGETLRHEVRLTNPGPGDIAIDRVRHSCSCTASSFEIDGRRYEARELDAGRALGVLSPGESARLEVELETTRVSRKQAESHLSKVVLVHTDDQAARPIAISLRAAIVTPWFVEPETLDLGRVRWGASASALARLTSDQLGEFRILDAISGCPEALRVHFEREPVARAGLVAWRVRIELLPGAPLGTTLTHVEFAVDDPRLRTIVLPVKFAVEPNVDFLDNRPDRMELLDFGHVVAGVGATLELAIENRRPEVPYVPTKVELSRARPTGAGITLELVEKVAGTSYVVRLTVPPELAKASFFQGEVMITADHPELPVKRVPYRGWYKPAGQ